MKLPLYARSSDIRTLALGQGCEGQWLLSNLLDDELPTTTWFALGTALHEGYELAIDGDLSTKEELEAYVRGEIRAVLDTEQNILESAAKRPKRTKDTMLSDGKRMAGKWWDDVHPDSDDRAKVFDRYEWPPKTEHNIAVETEAGHWLYTQVDAIFKGKKGEATFGMDTPIVDWKTGSTAKAAVEQLETYAYGGLIEDWFAEDQATIGFFWHVDHSKAQDVNYYSGKEQVELWIKRTYNVKEEILNDKQPVYRRDWWCGYCRARSICPAYGGSLSHTDVGNMVEEAIVIEHPEREEEE